MKYVSCTSRHFAAAFDSSAFQKGEFYTLAGAHLALQYFQALACRPLSLSYC